VVSHYIAFIEDAGPDTAIGVWFPDLPGCFSAGDTVDEALANAAEALSLYAESVGSLPVPRTLSQLKTDPAFASDIAGHIVALIPLKIPLRPAAE
jgi:predicted RNase H-like HicB family nuclease